MAMFGRTLIPFLLVVLNFCTIVRCFFVDSPPAINISHFLHPKVTALAESGTSRPTFFLQGVLDVIASKEKWNLEDIRVSEVDLNKAKFRTVKLYEFRIPHRKKAVIHVKMHEVVSEWKKLGESNTASNLEDLSTEIESKTTPIDSFTLEGPFELTTSGNDDTLTLMLPMNKTRSKLRKISVGEGIAVVVSGADAISGFYPSHHPRTPYTSIRGICRATPRIRINGSASVTAYRSTMPTSLIRTQTRDASPAIRLLPDKCYDDKTTQPLHSSFTSKIALLKRVLSTFLDDIRDPPIRASARASTVYRFRLELERDVRKNDAYWTAFPQWRTRPAVERAWFEVAARVEDGKLKPVAVKRVVGLGPVIDADRYSGGSVSNISFTKFPSLLVAPEALTLDVKW